MYDSCTQHIDMTCSTNENISKGIQGMERTRNVDKRMNAGLILYSQNRLNPEIYLFLLHFSVWMVKIKIYFSFLSLNFVEERSNSFSVEKLIAIPSNIYL